MKKRTDKTKGNPTQDDWFPSDEEFARFRPIATMDPALLAAHQSGTLKKRGRPALASKKEVVSIRLDPEILATLRSRGRGWQTELNAFLYQTYVKGKQPRL